MSDTTTSHVQQTFETFQALPNRQVEMLESLFTEMDRLEAKALEHNARMVEQMATMGRESVQTVSRMQAAQQTAVENAVPKQVVVGAATETVNRLRDSGADQAQASIDELAKLTTASMGYATRMSSEWRKLTLEAWKRSAQWMKPTV